MFFVFPGSRPGGIRSANTIALLWYPAERRFNETKGVVVQLLAP